MLDNQPWHCAGTNAYYAAQVDGLSADDVDTLFKVHASKGVNVLRVFAHSDGCSSSVHTPIQPSLGVYNEAALARLDLVLVTANKYNIRLILPFTNFEPFLGGMLWYAQQVAGLNSTYSTVEKELFYQDPRAQEAYKNYVFMMLNRKNTLNGGVRYKDDPTVFAWELANEPHTSDGYEQSRGIAPGSIVSRWIQDMASYVKSIDSNHLLFTGEEGYRSNGPATSSSMHEWVNNGLKGVDFPTNCADKNIDACTVHVYPDNWGYLPEEVGTTYVDDFLADRASFAINIARKPIIMEEYGMRHGYTASRDSIFDTLLTKGRELGYACSLVWSVNAGDFTRDGGSYVFKYGQDGSTALQQELNKNYKFV